MSPIIGNFFSTVGGQEPKSKLVMKNITSFALASAFASVAATAAVTDPVGYLTIPIPGTGGGGGSKLQLGNQGLLPSGPALVDDGTGVTFGNDVGGDFLEDADGAWTGGDYVNGAEPSHVLEVTSGAALVGTMSFITSTTDTPAKIYTADDLSSAGAGAAYRVWETYTMASLFGNPPTADVLGGGADGAEADGVQILDPSTNTYTNFFYKDSGKGTLGWQSSDGSITAPADYAIHPNDGLVILRKQDADGALTVSGAVKPGQTNVMVVGDATPGVTTLNIIANQIPVDQLTPGNSGLYTGNAATGLKGGADGAEADSLLVFDAATNSYTTFFYKDAGKGTLGWQSSDGGIAVPADELLPAEGALLIQRKEGASFNWVVPAVTVAP